MLKEYFTVREYGLRKLQEYLEEGYRVMIKAKKKIEYNEDFAHILTKERELRKLTILPGTTGEILEIEEDVFGIGWHAMIYPIITEMEWYNRVPKQENLIAHLSFDSGEEDDRKLEDLIIVDFPLRPSLEDPKQLNLFKHPNPLYV